jgi:hypothetical protein
MIIYYSMTLNIPTCFDPRRNITGDQTKLILQHKTKLVTSYIADFMYKSQMVKMKAL